MVSQERKKLVIVGDGACGKTCLLFVYARGTFPESYVPTVFENYTTEIKFDGKSIEMALWDTAGQEGYDRLRPLAYPDTNVILLAFSVDSIDSFENIRTKWVTEVIHFCPNAPLILVGNKKDLRDEAASTASLKSSVPTISYDQGVQLAHSIGAARYLETSAKTREGVSLLFGEAARLSMLDNRKQKKLCSIL
ncbi:hypothetical protein DSO57_1008279 [Entomophthora muscae]|uniref:Uncharacterized protein n=2 Tax=Entomophthora muscae TaxID=34485 RepID=A0ACC2UG71_9FUNG|nr:hypothetical protein DSO57_1008279 [Entomophthora muscae]